MTASGSDYRQIAAAVERATTPQEVVACLDDLARAAAAQQVSAEDADTLTSFAFRHLRELTEGTPDAARELILDRLLPACYGEGRRGHRLRATLHDWIEQYADEQRMVIRNAVLDRLLLRLPHEQSAATAWLLATIGFGGAVVKAALWESARRDDDVGDAALAALAVIGPTVDDRARIVRAILDRLPRREMTAFDYAVQELADPAFLPAISRRLAARNLADTLPLNHLARMAIRSPGDQQLQDEVWRTVQAWAATGDEHLRRAAYLGAVIRAADSPGVIRWLLESLRTEDAVGRHVVFERLGECFRPGQLAGWSVGDPGEWLTSLRRDAVRPSNAQGGWMTTEMRLRDQAWATALGLGTEIPSEWLQTAVTAEVSQIARHSVMNLAACLTFDPVPPVVAELVGERFAYARGDDTGGLFARIGAASVCRSSASLEAFHLLLGAGLTVDTDVLRSTATAVGELAVWLTRRGVAGIDEHLFSACEQVQSHHKRTLAAAGLEAMSLGSLLPEGCAARLGRLIDDAGMRPYVRSALVNAVGHLRCAPPPVEVVSTLLRLATEAEQADGGEDGVGYAELTLRSWEALIRLGLWRDHESLLAARLGFQGGEARPTAVEPRTDDPQRGYLLAMLAIADPERFAAVASAVLRDAGAESFYQMVGVFRRVGPVVGDSPYAPLCDAMADHVSASQGPTSVDTDGFAGLAEFAPTNYLGRAWENEWDGWMPIARVAFADALEVAVAAAPTRLVERARQLLLLLVADANYAVRRAAFRAFARLDPTELGMLCTTWLAGEEPGLLRRAAEAAGWLPLDRADTMDNAVLAALAADPEPSVRMTAREETKAAQRRTWAVYSLAMVSRSRSDGKAWVREAYRYGQALQHTGDDRSVAELYRLVNAPDVPPNVSHWLRQTAKETESNWRKAVERWPEPVEPLGALEVVKGVVRADGRVSGQVTVSLWQRFRQDRQQLNAWGGVLSPINAAIMQIAMFAANEGVVLQVEGRTPAKIIVQSTVSSSDGVSRAVFLGNEAYPLSLRSRPPLTE